MKGIYLFKRELRFVGIPKGFLVGIKQNVFMIRHFGFTSLICISLETSTGFQWEFCIPKMKLLTRKELYSKITTGDCENDN